MEGGERVDFFAEKSTPKLFETYLYVLLIRILNSHGFEVDERVLPLGDLMFTLSLESKVVLSNDRGCLCEILYDKALDDADKGFIESDYCSINSKHNRPDFILSFRDGNGVLTDSLVVEAKWRRLENIYSDLGTTDVMVNLRDYSNLCYYDCVEGKLKRGVVSKVLTVYPDVFERMRDCLGGLISFCGLNICKEIESTRGYAMIDSVVSSMIG